MKRVLFSLTLIISVITLNGCGGTPANPPADPIAINIGDIVSGYQFNGTIRDGEKAGENVILIFCPDYKYTYYRGDDESFHGTYHINDEGDEV